jgi:Periplasmic binding protein
MRRFAVLMTLSVLLGVACTSGDPASTGGDDGSTSTTGAADPAEAARAPGLTDTTIKVGVTYVDLEAIRDVVDTDHGDYQATYQALIDDINDRGGVNGRKLEPVFAPVNPVGTAPAEEACLKLTEDEEVFAVIGFIQGDSANCYLDGHETAVIGGEMTPERLERAKAPWFSSEPSSDQQSDVVRALAEGGSLDGKLGVVAISQDKALLEDSIEPLLADLDVKPAEVAIIDAPPGDTVVTTANAAVVAERFQSSGIDTVLVVGTGASAWSDGLETTSYRPQNRYAGMNELLSWINDAAGNDLSVLEGAVTGGPFGPKPDQWALPSMQKCLDVLDEAGISVPEPAAGQVPSGTPQPFVSAATGCNNMALVEALFDAAGKDLNYATLRAAGDGLEVQMPAWKDPMTYGPPPAADGDPTMYRYDWVPATKTLERQD